MRAALAEPNCKHGKLFELSKELNGRIVDEMIVREFWSLSLKETKLYSEPWKGWEEVIERWDDTISDIEEASKCYALSRYAGAVFHSLQVVEVGLLDLGEFIGVTDPKSGWTAVAHALKKVIDKPYKERNDFEKSSYEFLEQIQGTVEALKNAWRNKISHAQGRLILLTADFSPEVAEEILFAARAFMRRLAAGLPRRDI
jgi:hypothetical protein